METGLHRIETAAIVDAPKLGQLPLVIVDADGKILHANRATHRLFGYEQGDLTGLTVFEFLPDLALSDLTARTEKAARDNAIKDMIGRGKGGNPIPLAVEATSWAVSDSRFQHALVLRDVTEEMEAARRARSELDRANNAIKGARIGVFEYNPSDQTVIVSDTWRDLFDVTTTDSAAVQAEWRGRVHPEDLETALEAVRVCMEDIQERASCEYRVRSKDGTQWLWMQTDVAIARRNPDGKVIRIIGATTDITDRKTTENELRKSVAQFKSAFDNATVGVAIIGKDGSWQRVNQAICDLLGYSEEELLKTNFQSMTHPDDLEGDLAQLELLKSGSIPSSQLEKRYIRANGAIMWALVNLGTVRDAEGRPDHFISQIVDVTEQRRLSELRNEFVSTVSHELRTPLTSVLGALMLMSSMEDEPFSDEVQRLLYIAQENGQRLNSLVNDILDFEKFSAQRMRFTLDQHHIGGLIDQAVLTNTASADKFGVRFQIICPNRKLKVFVDPKRFQQVMTNLLTNAAKFAHTGTTVKVSVEGQATSVRISVINEGDGVPAAFRDHIFKPFSQAAASSKRARGGTGLGLNITKKIVEQTGGTIGFESVEGGKTTFWFTVPTEMPD